MGGFQRAGAGYRYGLWRVTYKSNACYSVSKILHRAWYCIA